MKQEKQTSSNVRALVFVRPTKPKEFVILALMVCSVLLGISPFINLINTPNLILGMPTIMFFSIINAFLVIVILLIAHKMEVH